MANEKCDFDTINLNSNFPTPCTLDFDILDLDSVGIRINMPAKASVTFDHETMLLSPDSRVPFCLAMQLPQVEVEDVDVPRNYISVVMTNAATGESITDNLISNRSSAPTSKADLSNDAFQNRVRRFYVNANLVEYLPIPAAKATYKVYALFKTYISNVVTIEIK